MKIRKFLVTTTLSILALTSSAAQAIEVSFEHDVSMPIVYLNVAVKAGSVTDPDGQSGLSNFMGEMLLRGTRSRTKEQIDLALDQMGAILAVETRAEALIVRGAVLSSQLDNFTKLVTEILTEPSFPTTEIRKLKSEIISGLLEELGNDSALATRKFTEYLFHGQPYGKPILGKIKDIEKLSREKIIAHYDRLIRDKNMLVVGSGDATDQTIGSWAATLAQARAGGEATPEVATPENFSTRRLQIVDKPDRTQTQINIGQIGVRMTDSDYFPLYLGNFAFGGGTFSSRLMVEIRVKRGWSYGANSAFRQGLKPRSWHAHLFPAAKDTPDALAYTLKMIQELQEKGITPEEFDFSQRSLVNSAGFMYNTPKKRIENKLLERTLNLPEGFMKSYGPELEKVSVTQVNDSLKKFLKPDQLAISVLGTAKTLKESLAKASGVPADKIDVVPYTQE